MSRTRCPLALLGLLAFAASAMAWTNDIEILNGGALNFGQVVAGPASGAVTMTPSGGRSSNGGVYLGNSGGARASEFTVTGDADAVFSVSLPSSITLTGSSSTMSVTNFVHDANGVLVGGSETFHVGATLQVAASQAAGAYSGTYMVTVDYQ